MKEQIKNKNFIDHIVDFFGKMKILKPLVNLYYKYREVWLYLFFGVLTTVINILIYGVVANVLQMNYMFSNVIAWIIAVMFAYITNRLYVFESKTTSKKELFKEVNSFFLARLFSLLIDMVIMYIGISIMNMNDMLIKVLANIVVIVANYIMSKFIIF